MDQVIQNLTALRQTARLQPRDERLVVFVTHLPMSRELKLAHDYCLVLVCTAPAAIDTSDFAGAE